MRVIAAALALLGLHAIAGFGQDYSYNDTKPGELKFETVSIKPAAPDAGGRPAFAPAYMVYVRGNTVYGRGATLEMMINFAYKRFPFADGKLRELEGPAWIRSTRYDVIAKPARPATQAEQRLMMRNMLAERFGLVVHVEDRPTDVYVLEVGKKGPKLVESSEPPDHVRLTGTWELKSKAGTMDELAFQISLWVLHCPVLNQTGLTGHYKFRLEYARPDPDPASAIPGAPAGENQTARASSDAPSIFNAIQQELGLKLSPRKMPLPVLIVDHAEPPTKN